MNRLIVTIERRDGNVLHSVASASVEEVRRLVQFRERVLRKELGDDAVVVTDVSVSERGFANGWVLRAEG